MSMRNLAGHSIAAIAGATMLALSVSPAPAFTLSGPSLETPVVSAQIEKVWWDRWGRAGIRAGITTDITAMVHLALSARWARLAVVRSLGDGCGRWRRYCRPARLLLAPLPTIAMRGGTGDRCAEVREETRVAQLTNPSRTNPRPPTSAHRTCRLRSWSEPKLRRRFSVTSRGRPYILRKRGRQVSDFPSSPT